MRRTGDDTRPKRTCSPDAFRNERRDAGTPEAIGGKAAGASARFFMLSVVTPTDARKNTESAIEGAREGTITSPVADICSWQFSR